MIRRSLLALTSALLALAACSKTPHGQASSGAGGDAHSSSTAAVVSCPSPSLAGFQPPTWVAPHPRADVCTEAEIDAYYKDCIDPTTGIPIACEQFRANHDACKQCLSPDDSTKGSGVLLARAGRPELNVGGCIALVLGHDGADSCGAREQVARDCASFACASCDGANCEKRARQGACGTYQMHTCPELVTAAACTLDRGFVADYETIARVFCSSS